MRRPIGTGGSAIQLRAYAPAAQSSPLPPGVPIEMLRRSPLTKPATRNAYRQRFGRSISLDRIETALRMAHGGSMMQLTDLSRETVETDPHLGAVLNKRFGAVSCLPYEVRPASGHGVDKGRALFYASVVREQLQNLTHFRRSIRQLAWALFDGRAALENFWAMINGPSHAQYGQVRLAVKEIGWIHPRRISFGPGRELVVTEERNVVGWGQFSLTGTILDAAPIGKFITWQPQLFGEYPEREGLASRCMYWSFFKRYGQRERMILLELFGKPWRIIEVDQESTAGGDELDDADEAIDGLGASYTARLPRGTKLQVVQPGRTAGHVHQEVVEESDKQISKLVLGQTGTTDGVPAGLNSNQASVMQDEQLMILTSDAAELSEVIENQLTDRIIAANFGEEALPHAPTFVLRSDLPADRGKEIERLQSALEAGLEVALAEAYETSGFRQPERTEALLRMDQPPTPPLAPTPPAARPVIVYPPGASPAAGEQLPSTPQSAADEGARDGAGVSVGSADQGKIITVNEAREGQGLPPLALPDGSPDPDGGLTVVEYEAKKSGKSAAQPAGIAGPEGEATDATGSTGPTGGTGSTGGTEPRIAETLRVAAADGVEMMVRKSGDEWCVYSEDGSRKFGCYPTKDEAEERLREVEGFKHMAAAAIAARGELAEQQLVVLADVLTQAGTVDVCCARQPDTVNGSVEDVLERGKPELQRAVNRWGSQLVEAFEGAGSLSDVLARAAMAMEQLDSGPFVDALEQPLVRSIALGALDSWFDDESTTTVEPPAFAAAPIPETEPAFSRMPFGRAMKYFESKNVLTKAVFERLGDEAKRKAFTVAALTQTRMLDLVHAELARHVGQGASLREFAPSFKARLRSAGFTAVSDKAEAAYVDNVFRTNTLGAYNAGRYERMSQPEVVKLRPYWQIRTVSDSRRRDNHRRADGLVLRADDSFWLRAYAPFGFNCRCRVVSLSSKQAEQMVITDGSTITYLPDPGFVSGVRSLLSGWWPRKVLL